ncbi:MAG: ADP-ribosylation factor-like protein [Candidatus Thorarchaeota archaeon]
MVGLHNPNNQPFFLILGPPNAGKTTLMYRLYSGIFYTTFQVNNRVFEEVRVDNVWLRALNIVENNLQKETWIPLTLGSSGIIFIVATTSNNKAETLSLFQDVRSINNLSQHPLLVVVNKIDLKKDFKFLQDLRLPEDQQHSFKIQKISCKTTEGIIEGIMWLMEKTETFFYIPTFRKQTEI